MIFKKKESTQELLGIEAITDYGISTKQGELVFFSVAPTNLSVLPADSIDARINALLNIIKGYDGSGFQILGIKECLVTYPAG